MTLYLMVSFSSGALGSVKNRYIAIISKSTLSQNGSTNEGSVYRSNVTFWIYFRIWSVRGQKTKNKKRYDF